MILDPIQEDREMCEVPGCDRRGTDWDHCIFTKNNKKREYHNFTYNPLNMLRACWKCNRITKKTDRWEAKKWLIDYHMDGEYRDEFLEWILSPPPKMVRDVMIYNYIQKKLDERIKK